MVLTIHVLLMMLISFLRAVSIVVVCQLSVGSCMLHDSRALEKLFIGNLDSTLLNRLELWDNEGVLTHLISESLFGLVGCSNLFEQTSRLLVDGRTGWHVLT